MPDRSPNEAFRATMEKLERLKERYSVKKIRECDWTRRKKQDPQVKAFVKGLKGVNPLEPSEAKTHAQGPPKGNNCNDTNNCPNTARVPPKVKGNKCHLPILPMVPNGK